MSIILLAIVSIFFALNMGASGVAVSFAPSYGSNLLSKNKIVILFTIFVLIGALLIGPRVAKTIGSKIIDKNFMTPDIVLIILTSASISIFIANILKIPQSTSIVTVGAVTGIGIYFKSLKIDVILKMIFFWLFFSILSYFISYFITKKIYPPNENNFRFYEKFFKHKNKFKLWVILTDIYSAFGIGTNNVANVVGPLSYSKIFHNRFLLFIIFSLIFGLGAFILGQRTIKTVGKDIVPIGVISASIISFIVTTLIVLASVFGLPAPYVQFSTMAILAVSTAKEETQHIIAFKNPLILKIFKIWIFSPILSIGISYLLVSISRGGLWF